MPIGVVSIELPGAREVVLVGKLLRVRLESYKGPRMRDPIRIPGKELPERRIGVVVVTGLVIPAYSRAGTRN